MTILFEVIKAELLADPEVKREYDALAPEFEALTKKLGNYILDWTRYFDEVAGLLFNELDSL